jgi:uncharacterized protein (DUF1501 family)
MKTSQEASRRVFLRQAAALSTVGVGVGVPFGMNMLAMNASMAAGSCAPLAGNDYKALVCIFLVGGNDSHNTVLATDDATWGAYEQARTGTSAATNLVIDRGSVLPITPLTAQPRPGSAGGARSFGLHPALAPLQQLFNGNKRLAVVANVGTLQAPTSKADYGRPGFPLPPMLGSHNDQQSIWQAGGPEGSRRGWGGSIGDLIACSNNPNSAVFSGISPAGNSLWLAGDQMVQYAVLPGSGKAVALDAYSGGPFGVAAATPMFTAVTQRARDSLFEKNYSRVVKRAKESRQQLETALNGANVRKPSGGGYLGQQLQAVARNILAASNGGLAGMRRQVFFCSMGGYDTHDGQIQRAQAGGTHADLLLQLAQALRYFHDELESHGLIDKVTTFTASDFGRMLVKNRDGTDHGWGGHHFVMGGSVKGGDIYGQFPDLTPNSEDTVEAGRILLPRIAVDQYGATLGKWFGLSDAQLKQQVFPNLATFTDGAQAAQYPLDLGFLRA